MKRSPSIFIDADDCPHKEEIYRVAQRYSLEVKVVSNSERKVPKSDLFRAIVVEKQFDAVDNWIFENIQIHDIVITNDLLLSDRCLKKGAKALNNRGKEVTLDTIGEALASRELMSQLRAMGMPGLGPKTLKSKDRSEFLNTLDRVIHSAKLGK